MSMTDDGGPAFPIPEQQFTDGATIVSSQGHHGMALHGSRSAIKGCFSMTILVTDEMVEAAAIACSESAWAGSWTRYASEGGRDVLRKHMRAALEGAAPTIRKAALEEAAKWHDYQAGYARSLLTPDISYGQSDLYLADIAHHEGSAAVIRTLGNKEQT